MFFKELPGSGWVQANVFEKGTWPKDGRRIFACTKDRFMFYGRFSQTQMIVYSDLYGNRPIAFGQLMAWQYADENICAGPASKPSLRRLF